MTTWLGCWAARLGGGAAAAVLLVATQAGAASARWSAGGSGSGHGRAATLQAPAQLTAACAGLVSSAVDLAWTGSALATSYTVQRSVNGGGFTDVHTTTQDHWTDPGTGLPLVSVTVQWRVIAKVGGWTATSASSPSRTVTTPSVCV